MLPAPRQAATEALPPLREVWFENAAGGCPKCGPRMTVFASEPAEPVAFDGLREAHFRAHVGDLRKPCDVCRPKAHAAWMAEFAAPVQPQIHEAA